MSNTNKIAATFFAAVFLFLSLPETVSAVGDCCVYSKESTGGSCYILNAAGEKQSYPDSTNSNGDYIFKTDFNCANYFAPTTAIAQQNSCPYGFLNDAGGGGCLNQGDVLKKNNISSIVAAYLKTSLPATPGSNLDILKQCLPVSGYSLEEVINSDTKCTAGRSGYNVETPPTAFADIEKQIFQTAFFAAVEDYRSKNFGPIAEYMSLLKAKKDHYCCVPKYSSGNYARQCSAPKEVYVQDAAGAAAAVLDVNKGADLSKYYKCEGSSDYKFPVACSDNKWQIADPEPGTYKYEGTYLNVDKLCKSLNAKRVCLCETDAKVCNEYPAQTSNTDEDLANCDKKAKESSPNNFCRTEPKSDTNVKVCQYDSAASYVSSNIYPSNASELNQLGTTDVKEFIARIIQGLLGILGSISLVMFIYGGILLMTDRGSGDQAGTAKEILVWTSLGLAVVFASYAILKFVFEFFS